jgi:hypothetical protein
MVQPPEKPKPFLNHNIASKPAMVRRAVVKDWKPPIFGTFFFTRKRSLSMPCWRCLVPKKSLEDLLLWRIRNGTNYRNEAFMPKIAMQRKLMSLGS